MHFVEIEFLRRGDADQHREMRDEKDGPAMTAVRIREIGTEL
jgi:hypothetical protein